MASTSNAWCTTTEKPDLESFQVVVGDGAECPSSQDKTREDGKNTQVQEDIAFPAMMKIGTSTPPGDTAVFIDTTASSHIVTAESRLCQHVVKIQQPAVCAPKDHADFRAQHPKERSCFASEMNEVSW